MLLFSGRSQREQRSVAQVQAAIRAACLSLRRETASRGPSVRPWLHVCHRPPASRAQHQRPLRLHGDQPVWSTFFS